MQYLRIDTQLDNSGNSKILLVFEDVAYNRLDKIIPANGFNMDRFLNIAIEVCKALIEVHFNKVIHMNMKPKKIVLPHSQFLQKKNS